MTNPTHYIEVYADKVYGVKYTQVFPIEILDLCIDYTNTTSLLYTVAIFKIKSK